MINFYIKTKYLGKDDIYSVISILEELGYEKPFITSEHDFFNPTFLFSDSSEKTHTTTMKEQAFIKYISQTIKEDSIVYELVPLWSGTEEKLCNLTATGYLLYKDCKEETYFEQVTDIKYRDHCKKEFNTIKNTLEEMKSFEKNVWTDFKVDRDSDNINIRVLYEVKIKNSDQLLTIDEITELYNKLGVLFK